MTMRDLMRWNRGVPVRTTEDNPFYALQDEMYRMFDDFFGHGFTGAPTFTRLGWPEGGYAPKVEVEETDKGFTVKAEMPGMTEKDIEVTLAREFLTIKGEKKEETEHKEGNYFRTERTFGRFHRVVPLPCEVVTDKVDATFKNGVLTVKLTRAEPAKGEATHVEIKAA